MFPKQIEAKSYSKVVEEYYLGLVLDAQTKAYILGKFNSSSALDSFIDFSRDSELFNRTEQKLLSLVNEYNNRVISESEFLEEYEHLKNLVDGMTENS